MEDQFSQGSDRSNEPAPAKRPYATPVLVTWGTLRDITQAVGNAGNDDGGKGKQPRRTR